MKKNFSRLLVLLLALAVLASQMMVPAFAADSSTKCSCDAATRVGTELFRTPATCTEYGIIVYECNACEKQYAVNGDAPTGHSMNTVAAQDPTCTNVGWNAYEKCSVCNATEGYLEIAAKGHHYVIELPLAPTCTTTGHTGYKVCTVCNSYAKYPQEKPALGHTAGTPVRENEVAPTCTVDGSYDEVVYCTVCDVELSRTPTVDPATKHDYGTGPVAVEAATCTEEAYELYVCSVCQYNYKKVTAPALEHDEKIDPPVDATCTETGLTEGKHCDRCDEILVPQTEVPALGHDYDSVVTAPNCKEQGYTTHVCKNNCGDIKVDTYTPVDPSAHVHEITKYYVAATCGEDGHTAEVTCSVCEKILVASTVIPATGNHTPDTVKVENKVDPTCTEDGSHDDVVYCAVCKQELSRTSVVDPKLGHDADAPVKENDVAPTCTTDGSYDTVEYCAVCDEELSRVTTTVPMLGHDEKIDAYKAPTCTETGLTEGKHCDRCKEVLIPQDVIPANGHSGLPTEGVVNATCLEGAYTVYLCQVCNEHYKVYDETKPALGHTEEAAVNENVVAPDCTNDGSHDEVVYCETCDEELSRTTVVDPAKGHFSIGEDAKAPTCTQMGHTGWDKCVVCGVYTKYAERIPALGHDEVVLEGKEATFDEAGLTEGKHCNRCNIDTVPQVVIPVKDEKVTFTYKATGINGADVAVNSGYVTYEIWMNVETEQARLWGVDIDLTFDSRLNIVDSEDAVKGCIFETLDFTAIETANANKNIKITQGMPITLDPAALADRTFAKGEYLYATITFKVDADCANSVAPLAFTINTANADDCAYARITTTNSVDVDFGTGAEIYVDMLGDTNNDGVINVNDSLSFVQWLAGADLDDYNTVCDMDKNGTINAKDYALLRQAIAGNNSYLEF